MTGTTWKLLYIQSRKCLRDTGLKVNSCEASCGLQTPTVCFDISHSDHNNRGHSSSASVCQSEERGEAGREVSTQSVSTCYKRPLKPPLLQPQRGEGGGGVRRGLWLPESSGLTSWDKNTGTFTLKLRPPPLLPPPPSPVTSHRRHPACSHTDTLLPPPRGCHVPGWSPFLSNPGLIGLLLKHIHSLLITPAPHLFKLWDQNMTSASWYNEIGIKMN